jgi:hypothetical protein
MLPPTLECASAFPVQPGRRWRVSRALPAACGGWHDDDVDYLLAQVNIARMLAPLDSEQLADFGPTAYVFTLREHFSPPDVADPGPIRSPEGWTCPA